MSQPSLPSPRRQPPAGGSRPSRRSLLRGALTTGALGTAGALAGLPAGAAAALASGRAGLPAAGSAAAAEHDLLVVLTLRGGFDALSAVVPADDPDYRAQRPGIAVPADLLLPLDSRFGLHPAMRPLHRRWREGSLAVVHAVGQNRPSRSHQLASAALDRGAGGVQGGWLDRAFGATRSALPAVFLGSTSSPGSLAGAAAVGMDAAQDFDLSGLGGAARQRWLAALTALAGSSPELDGPVAATVAALTAWTKADAGDRDVERGDYPDTDLGRSLRRVVDLLRADLGVRTVCVEHPGWDLHAAAGDGHEASSGRRGGPTVALLTDLAASLDAFADDLGRDLDRVTVVTVTEFGRRVGENGTGGTDHGSASAMLLLGGGVRGGEVYGSWPGLAAAEQDRGGLRITTDHRRVLAEVLQRRCGVAVDPVFPGLPDEPLGVVRSR